MQLSVQFSSVQSLSLLRLFATPWTAAHQASLSITNSWSLLKFMSIESVMPSNHLILCRPLLLLPPIFPSIRVFSNESALRIIWPFYLLQLHWCHSSCLSQCLTAVSLTFLSFKRPFSVSASPPLPQSKLSYMLIPTNLSGPPSCQTFKLNITPWKTAFLIE